ncbi:hypothetical protein RND81_08G216000 [Saponaria officinalis]|uniref:Homeobox domain-containing protein n=1 Tax=Saponaria officinalis TaxID=3572 RepID=A0AAW1JAZ2_SAPOF
MDDPFHHPHHNRRHKLRFNDTVITAAAGHPLLPDHLATSPATSALNLSLSTHARTTGAYSATPVGPFTGYASILARSRFLRPAQDLLDAFSAADAVSPATATKKILEESGRLFSDDDEDVISRRCTNPNLVSMLHEVYKKYKLYCQQMQSAVTSFESVAGLANAAPFISFAVRAMFRHFHCLKNAILDQIRVTSKGFGDEDCRRERDSGSCPDDKSPCAPKQGLSQNQGSGPNFLQHPVWRSQRGFPDKAVAVLRTWLFEHFLHPYPSDSDKQMLAQKTGLSRSQVSNWFTNARVRLWKPMVEEIHTLERKAQCSKSAATNTQQLINLSSDNHSSIHPQLTEKDFEIVSSHRNHESHSKRTRTETDPRAEQSKERFSLLSTHSIPGNQINNIDGLQIDLSHQQNTSGLSWSPQGQIIPFWLARQ